MLASGKVQLGMERTGVVGDWVCPPPVFLVPRGEDNGDNRGEYEEHTKIKVSVTRRICFNVDMAAILVTETRIVLDKRIVFEIKVKLVIHFRTKDPFLKYLGNGQFPK